MFDKDKYRRFKLKDKDDEENEDEGIHFRRITRKRPTKNVWVLLAILVLIILLIIMLSQMGS